jgi:hypothetical protein
MFGDERKHRQSRYFHAGWITPSYLAEPVILRDVIPKQELDDISARRSSSIECYAYARTDCRRL